MIIKLSEVKGLMVDNKTVPEYCEDYQSWGNMGDAYDHGYEQADAHSHNQAITQQSQRSIEVVLDRDRLALIIWKKILWLSMTKCKEMADAIISAPDLITVKYHEEKGE